MAYSLSINTGMARIPEMLEPIGRPSFCRRELTIKGEAMLFRVTVRKSDMSGLERCLSSSYYVNRHLKRFHNKGLPLPYIYILFILAILSVNPL